MNNLKLNNKRLLAAQLEMNKRERKEEMKSSLSLL